MNWYRNRRVNFENEKSILDRRIEVPVLFIGATKDLVLNPKTWVNNEKYISKLTTRTVESGHWVLWHKPDEVNKLIGEWIAGVVEAGQVKL